MPVHAQKGLVYSNYRLEAPDGVLISRIGEDRANWYLKRNLAQVVCRDPFTIRLNFEPKGRGNEGDLYYLSDKENKCVVCGEEGEVNKHHIIPKMFRSRMAPHCKGRSSHDIVILCLPCHVRYETEATIRKKAIAEEHGFLPVKKLVEPSSDDARELKARRLASALVKNRKTIPLAKAQLMEEQIAEFLDDMSEESLAEFASKRPRQTAGNQAEEMVRHVLSRVDVEEFGIGWRRHFLEVMKPQHLPVGWDVNRPISVR